MLRSSNPELTTSLNFFFLGVELKCEQREQQKCFVARVICGVKHEVQVKTDLTQTRSTN